MLTDTIVKTPDSWLKVAHSLTKRLTSGRLTTRDDVVVQVLDDDTCEACPIAWHVPATSDIVLNAGKITDMRTLAGHDIDGEALPYGIATTLQRVHGVLAHEAGHSQWSHYIREEWLKELSGKQRTVITQLEEIRIESWQVRTRPAVRSMLRTSAQMLLPSSDEVRDMITAKDGGGIDVAQAALSSALTIGRADVNVLLPSEVNSISEVIEDIVGYERFTEMRRIWTEFAGVALGEEEARMPAIAQRWVDLFPSTKSDEKKDSSGPSIGAPGESGTGGGDGSGEDSDTEESDEVIMLPGLIDDLAKAAEEVAEEAEEHPRASGASEDGEGTDEKSMATAVKTSVVFEKKRSNRRTHSRAPRASEHKAATVMARELQKLSVRERSETTTRSQVPPGRLHTRSAVAAAAERSQGRAPTSLPWEQRRRKYSDTPKLTVGVMTDVSGSMGWAQEFVASASWVISKAVRRINGDVAAVTFGTGAEPTYGPRDNLASVTVRSAIDGSEAFTEAVAALDGSLRLSDPRNGVRVLFVVSDGMLVAEGEMARAAAWVKRLTRAGCAVVWVTNNSHTLKWDGHSAIPAGATPITVRTFDIDVETTVKMMAQTVVAELKRRSARA